VCCGVLNSLVTSPARNSIGGAPGSGAGRPRNNTAPGGSSPTSKPRGRASPTTAILPEAEFDLEAATAAFDKESVYQNINKEKGSGLSDEEADAYDCSGFFDTLSCESLETSTKKTKEDWAAVRKIDTETFGGDVNKIRYDRGGPGRSRAAPRTNTTSPSTGRGGGRGAPRGSGRGRASPSGDRVRTSPTNSGDGYSGRGIGRGKGGKPNQVFRVKDVSKSNTTQGTEPVSGNKEGEARP